MLPLADAVIKLMSPRYPLVQLLWIRFFFPFWIIVLITLWRHGPRAFVTDKTMLLLCRALFILSSTFCFVTAIKYIPLADGAAIASSVPLILIVLLAIILRERIPLTRWLAVLLGLVGILIIIRPGLEGYNPASLYALAAARDMAYPDAHERGLFAQPAGRFYASDQSHSSIEKGVLTLGFGRDGYRAIPSDSEFRMRPDALRSAIESDIALGVRPVAVVATLGTTSTSSIDPVGAIASLAREFGIWLHVDAAYAGPAAIVPELRPLLAGWEHADSIVVNPHKWLFTPIDCSVLYCRHPERLVRSFSIVPEYLTTPHERGEPGGEGGRNLMDYGVSLGRRFRSLKLWFVLRAFGLEGIIERLRAHVAMAREFTTWIDEAEQWKRVAPTPLSTVAFRFLSAGTDAEELDWANLRILERLNRSGEVLLTHTELGGRVALRLSIGNLRTTQAHVRRVWELLQEAAEHEGAVRSH